MYSDKAIEKVVNWAIDEICPEHIGLIGIAKCPHRRTNCFKRWQSALTTEPEGDNG